MEEESGFLDNPMLEDDPGLQGITGLTLIYESASGTFRIYAGRHFGRKVIFKVPGSAHSDDPLVRSQLEKEFSLGFNIDHPGVCRTYALLNLSDGMRAIEM